MRGLNTPGAVQYAEQRMKENILLSLDRCAGNCVSDMLALVRRTLLPNTDVCQAGSRLCGSMSTLWISRSTSTVDEEREIHTVDPNCETWSNTLTKNPY
jgi:hypothetical protein